MKIAICEHKEKWQNLDLQRDLKLIVEKTKI